MSDPFRVWIGYDQRQPVAFTVLVHSILKYASKPVQICPLVYETLPLNRKGLTPFTWTRFLVPWLCDYKGWALFMDIDMMVRGDITELEDMKNESDVLVCKNERQFEWASLMYFNNEKCRILTPDYVNDPTVGGLHKMSWSNNVGSLPMEWNHLVGYDKPKDAKVVHFTQGIPAHKETNACEYSEEWQKLGQESVSTWPWENLMGQSVHREHVKGA